MSLKEKIITIDEEDYHLLPDANDYTIKHFEEDYQFSSLYKVAKQSYCRDTIDSPLKHDHIHVLKKHFPEELCQSIIEEFNNNPEATKHSSIAKILIEQAFTANIDEHIRSYFESEYCIFWWSIYKIEADDEEAWYSTKWHCDGGPIKQLKALIYLNGYDEHESDTGYLDKNTTDKLKDTGYIFNNLNHRTVNLSPLCKYYNIDFSPQGVKPETGDLILFNANQLAHRAMVPKKGKARYVLNFCLLPSKLDRKTVEEEYYFPSFDCQDFCRFPPILDKISDSKKNSIIEIDLNYKVINFRYIEYLLMNIIKDEASALALINYVKTQDASLKNCGTLFDLMRFIKTAVLEQFSIEKLFDQKWIEVLADISTYEKELIDSKLRYNLDNKPDPNAIFWPNPTHTKYPQSKYNMLPYVSKEPIMDISTPIGSAGSCFAFEIAKYFQQANYNYVVTERNDDPNSGILVDGYQPGDKIAKFCANFGILFNTPSFMQLAEKAFGIRQFNKLLFKNENGFYLDPYRENVLFENKEAYLLDYDKHINAVKEAFLKCKVFVVTLGLNECWELKDGTVMSRNPRENMYHLVKHKTLTVQENVDNIQRFFDIIKKNNPDFKLVISISPIPFLATGRADKQHIISANCHSKSVLRVAADELVANNQDMYYLPSYELVNECIHDAWEEDTRHVKSSTVEKVVQMFKEIFVI